MEIKPKTLLNLADILEILVDSHRSLSSNENAYHNTLDTQIELKDVDRVVDTLRDQYEAETPTVH